LKMVSGNILPKANLFGVWHRVPINEGYSYNSKQTGQLHISKETIDHVHETSMGSPQK
jgi:hypothetical protein